MSTVVDTRQQRQNALHNANAVRFDRARIKREIRDGVIELDILLAAPPATCRNVPVFETLQWLRGIGETSARNLIKDLLSETLIIEHLGERTRARLLERVADKLSTGAK